MNEKKPFIKTILTIGRGVLKALPIGNILVELSQNKQAKNLTEPIRDENGNEIKPQLPHNYLSIIIQIICILGVSYAFITDKIDIHKLLNLLLNFI